MTHHDVHINDIHEGDALHIPIIVRNAEGDRKNLTDATVEWFLKDDKFQSDTDAIITKSSDVGPGEVEITSAYDGEATIKLSTGDTDSLITTGEESETYYHLCRIVDSQGRRLTIFHGDFELVI